MAVGAKTNATTDPTILGVQVTTSLYNTAIPLLIGKRRCAPECIWYGYFGKSGSSGKKGKSGKKGGATTYQSNLDLLISFGPIWNIQSCWQNSNLLGYSATVQSPFSHMGGQTFAISNADSLSGELSIPGGINLDFISAISFIPTSPLSATVDVYGDPLGSHTITEAGVAPAYSASTDYAVGDVVSYDTLSSGSPQNWVAIADNYDTPPGSLGYWAAAPNYSEQWLYNTYNNYSGSGAGAVAWRPGSWEFGMPMCNNASCEFTIGTDHGDNGFNVSFPSPVTGVIFVYYGYTEANHDNPLTYIKYEFEAELGSGNEFNGSLSGQQVEYPELSGVGGVQVDLGASGTVPELDLEPQGLYSLTKTGQANPADIILDLILSGNIFINTDGGSNLAPDDFTPLCFSHGLNFGGDPTRINLFGGSGNSGSVTWPPMVSFPYVLPQAGGAGNSTGASFNILRDPPVFDQGVFNSGNYYNINSVVQGSDLNYYIALCNTNADPVSGDQPDWALYTGPIGAAPPTPQWVYAANSGSNADTSITTPSLEPESSTDWALIVSNSPDTNQPAGWNALGSGVYYKQLSSSAAWSADLTDTAINPTVVVDISFPTLASNVTEVQHQGVDQDLVSSPYTLTFSSNVTAGNTIIAIAQNLTGVSFADSNGNSYSHLSEDASGGDVDVFIAFNVPGGALSGTFTWSGHSSGYGFIAIYEMNGFRVLPPAPFSDGLTDVRDYCAANGIYASLYLKSQRPCDDILNDICEIANCTPVWNGQSLDFYPYSEVAQVGGGYVYTPRTASGPLAEFDANYFVVESNEAPVTVKQENMQSVANILDINYSDAGFDGAGACSYQSYQSNSVRICDAEHCFLYGPQNGSPRGFDDYLTDATTATLVGWPIMKRQRFADPYSVEFKLPQTIGSLLDPMDLITVVDPLFGGTLNTGVATSGSGQQDVRISELSEDNTGTWSLSCERFMYGMSAPIVPNVTISSGVQQAQPNVLAGSVNAPYFFEPTAALAVALGMSAEGGIGIAVSGSADNYGGCVVNVSTDGGNSYDPIGKIAGSSVMGVVYSAGYPSSPSPDSTDTLYVDLTESDGELESYTSAQQNQLVPIMLLDNSGAPGTGSAAGYTTTIPYEIIAYQATTLVSTSEYSAAPPILRGQLGTVPADHPASGVGSPPSGSPVVDLSTPGSIFTYVIPNGQIAGNTLYFKFQTFNQFGTGLQDISDCTVYTFTITGQTNPTSPSSPAAGGSYTVAPNPCLYQGRSGGWSGIDSGSGSWTNADDIYFPPVTVNFASGSVSCDANDAGTTAFTGPGQTVYVCIYDPSHAGGTPTVDVQATNEHATTPGYIYLGSITSAAAPTSPGSTGGSSAPGGPQDSGVQSYVVECNGTPISVANE
jgi:hypothetical protein